MDRDEIEYGHQYSGEKNNYAYEKVSHQDQSSMIHLIDRRSRRYMWVNDRRCNKTNSLDTRDDAMTVELQEARSID